METEESWKKQIEQSIYRITTQIQDLRQEINNLRKKGDEKFQ